MRDPRFMVIFRKMAEDAAEGMETGWASIGPVLRLAYYPASGRYSWFDREGPITRAQALKWLLSTDSIKRVVP